VSLCRSQERVEQYIAAYDYTYEGTYTINGSSLVYTIDYLLYKYTYGVDETFKIINYVNGETADVYVTEQTYHVNGNNLTIERKSNVPDLNISFTEKRIFKKSN